MANELQQRLIAQRREHPAWLLVASRNGPLTIASLKELIEKYPTGVEMETAVESLAAAFAENANDSEFDVGEDHATAARKELRSWMKRGLLFERNGQLFSTDALERALAFLNSLNDRTMTSTASRLATVQQAIETLEVSLSADQQQRGVSIRRKIATLEKELESVEAGTFEVLDGPEAVEGIREVHNLAMSLQNDFRRVEDSFRDADRQLRQRMITERHHRGEIVDELLDGHEEMLKSTEGQVFHSFHEQLKQSVDLEQMKQRIRSVLENPIAETALLHSQRVDLRLLVSRLVQESRRVIEARARGERDVRAFLRSGLADEQLRVGSLLQDVLQAALEVDWDSQTVRRLPSPLPPIAIAAKNRPLIERLLIRDPINDQRDDLDLSVQEADATVLDDEFWAAYQTLDREQLFKDTLTALHSSGEAMTLLQLAEMLPPTHDLETLAYWLTIARQTGAVLNEGVEQVDLPGDDDHWLRFTVPRVKLAEDTVSQLSPETLE